MKQQSLLIVVCCVSSGLDCSWHFIPHFNFTKRRFPPFFFSFRRPAHSTPLCVSRGLQRWFGHEARWYSWNRAMAEFGNGLAEESLLDSDPGHPELEDPGVGDEEPGLEEGEAAIEDPVSEGHCFNC